LVSHFVGNLKGEDLFVIAPGVSQSKGIRIVGFDKNGQQSSVRYVKVQTQSGERFSPGPRSIKLVGGKLYVLDRLGNLLTVNGGEL
jgi:hypothetical protein